MKNSIVFPGIVLGLFLSPLILHAQSGVGVLQGTVTDESGQPIKDVEVIFQSQNTNRKYKLKTDKKGEYFHGGVNLQATYTVVAKKEGYRTEYESSVRAMFGIDTGSYDPTGGGKRGRVDFVLTKGKSGKLAFEMSPEERKQFMEQQAVVAEVSAAYNKGIMAFNLEQFDEAAIAFRECVSKDPKRPAIWANLGNAYLKLGKHENALESYNKAIELAPTNATFYQNLGNIFNAKGDLEQAKNAFQKSAELSAAVDPKAAASNYYNLGVTFINNGKSQEASEALKNAVASDPEHAEAHYQLGIVLLGMNKVTDAIKHLSSYSKISPNGPNSEVAKSLVAQLESKK